VGKDGIDAEASRLAAQIDRAVIHGIAEIPAGIAANHHAAALHHEARERAGIAADDDRAALLVDAGTSTHRTPANQIAAADRRTKLRARVLFDQDRAGEHVLAASPANAAFDADIRTVEKAAGEVAARALDIEV